MRRTVWLRLTGLVLGLAFGLSLEAGAAAQAGNASLPAAGAQACALAVKRLILTDGSYQAVTEWKTVGERVEYYSAERGAWEEVPAALVDWKATEAWNAEASKSQGEALKQESAEEVAERKQAQLNTPLVAPKLAPEMRLPSDGGVFVLEWRAGRPVLQKLAGVKSWEDDHDTANLVKRTVIPIPIGGTRQTIELKGAAAKVRVHAAGASSASPAIFVDVENDQGVIEGGYFRIVRLVCKRELRVVAENRIGPGGSESTKETFLHSRAEKFSGDWWKVIPLEELTPGEYAIVIDGVRDYVNGLVWDFGVDK